MYASQIYLQEFQVIWSVLWIYIPKLVTKERYKLRINFHLLHWWLCFTYFVPGDRFSLVYRGGTTETQLKIISAPAGFSHSKLQCVCPRTPGVCLCGRVVKITRHCGYCLPCYLDLPHCYCSTAALWYKRNGSYSPKSVCTPHCLMQIQPYCCKADHTANCHLFSFQFFEFIITKNISCESCRLQFHCDIYIKSQVGAAGIATCYRLVDGGAELESR